MTISRTVVNFLLDSLLFLLTIGLLFTSAVLRFVFPTPSASSGWTLWGASYDAWSNLQFGLVAVVALAILLHIMMHWSWVCGVVLTKLVGRRVKNARLDDGSQTLWGVAMLIVVVNLLGVLVGLAYLTASRPS